MKIRVALATALVIALSGCSGNTGSGSSEGTIPPGGQSASQAKSVQEKAATDRFKPNGKLSPDYFKERLHPRISAEEATREFGTGYTIITRREAGISKWRFDYGDVGYQFQNMKNEQPDLDALRKGMIHEQLFLTWDPALGRTVKAELYYKVSNDHADHRVKVFTVNDNGERSEGRVD